MLPPRLALCKQFLPVALTFVLLSCTPYPYHKHDGLLGFGGYTDKRLKPDFWIIGYSLNPDGTHETLLAYWLYHAAEVTLEQGYDGFDTQERLTLRDDDGFEPLGRFQVAGPVYVPIYIHGGPAPVWPEKITTIKLLRRPFITVPRRVFDAAKLKAALDPLVHGPKCDLGNVCAPVATYIDDP